MKDVLQMIIKKFLTNKKVVIFISLLLLLSVGLGQAVPLINGYVVDLGIVNNDKSIFTILVLVIVALLILEALSRFVFNKILIEHTNKITCDLRSEIFHKMVERNYEFFETNPVGNIMVKINLFVNEVSENITKNFSTFIINLLSLIVTFVFMLTLNYIMAFIILGFYIIIFTLIFLYTRVLKNKFIKFKDTHSKNNAFLLEYVSGFETIVAYNRHLKALSSAETTAKQHDKNRDSYYRIYYSRLQIIDFIVYLAVVAIFICAFFFMGSGMEDVGIIVSFLGYVTGAVNIIRNINDSSGEIARLSGYSENIDTLLGQTNEVKYKKVKTDKPDIEFINVSNKHIYKGVVLRDINLKISFGQNILVTGHHGSGKSTLGRLLTSLYSVSSGKILIGGVNIKKIAPEELHKIIGYCDDGTFLFKNSIFNNVLMARPEATEEEVLNAIKISGLEKITSKLKSGANTIIRDEYRFSSGDKQLIGLARIILQDPKILVIDESFANTDLKTMEAFRKVLDTYGDTKTIIYISSNRNFGIKFDKVIRLKKGRIMRG